MKKRLSILLVIFTFVIPSKVFAQEAAKQINIIPKPKSILINDGVFKLNSLTKIYYKKEAKNIAEYLAQIINPSTGYNLKFYEWDGSILNNSIIISLSNSENDFVKEGYTLVVNRNNVMIEAAQLNGLFYGVQTLRQLFPVEIESQQLVIVDSWEIPCVNYF